MEDKTCKTCVDNEDGFSPVWFMISVLTINQTGENP